MPDVFNAEQDQVSGGEALIRVLVDEGVEYLFGYPGGAALHIYDAIFKQQRIEHILVRHEQAAVHMADGYARSTGRPGVVLVTSGPGATNAVTGIATAYMDSIPMVVLSSQVPTNLIGTDAFQETDVIGVTRPIVKHSFLVMTPEAIVETIQKAFYIASTGRPGPVLVDIPKDITDPAYTFPYAPSPEINLRAYRPAATAKQEDIQKAADLLLTADRPVFYVGGGAVSGNAHKLVREMANQLDCPVTQTLMGLGVFPGTDAKNLGMLGMHGTYEANMAMHHADVIFAIGARFDDRVTNHPSKFCPEARIIHLDVDAASIGKIVPVDIALVGMSEQALQSMLSYLHGQKISPEKRQTQMAPWWTQIDQWRAQQGLDHSYQSGVHAEKIILPQTVIKALYRVTKGKAFISSDVGQHQMFAAQYYHFDEPHQWINSGGLGTMGFGLPAAMGVALAHPEALSVVVTGEGSIQMNIQELSTCAQYGLPIKIINLNNHSLGMVKQWQDISYGGRHSQSTYQGSLPDFVRLAESYGHVGMQVTKPEALESALEKAFSLDFAHRLVFLDILVDPDEHVYPMAIKGGAMNDMMLSKTKRT